MSPYASASLESGITSEVPGLNNCSEQELKIFGDCILVQEAAVWVQPRLSLLGLAEMI